MMIPSEIMEMQVKEAKDKYDAIKAELEKTSESTILKKWYVSYWFRIGSDTHFMDTDRYEATKFDPAMFKGWLAETFIHGEKADKIVILYVQEI